MHAYAKSAVLMFALSLASAALAAGKGGSAPSAAPSSAASPGTIGATRSATGSSSAVAHGGSSGRADGMYGNYRSAPELDPKRKINEQDCTKPIVHDAGNLRCK
jgi:hypothetical protein